MDINDALEELHLSNYDEAVALFKDAAASGNPDACDFLVQIYRLELSSLVTKKDALEYAIKGYEYRSRDGCYNLGTMYRTGFLGSPDYSRAYDFFTEGSSDLHDLRCSFELGEMLRLGEAGNGPRVDEAVKHYSKAAAGGYYPAQFQLACIFERVVKDFDATLEFYRSSADKGHVDAMLRLGYIYEKGIRVESDLPTAVDWYTRASDAGSAEGFLKISRLVLCSSEGRKETGIKPEELADRLKLLSESGRDTAEPLYLLGCIRQEQGDSRLAGDLFYQSALNGCLPALCRYASIKLELAGSSDRVEALALLHVVRIVASSMTETARKFEYLMSPERMIDTAEKLISGILPELSDSERTDAGRMADEKIGQMFGLHGASSASAVRS
jgi:TPR repeat protein